MIAPLYAKDGECNFKKIILETRRETYVSCELKDAKYDGRNNFEIIVNNSALQHISGHNPDDEYIDEDRIIDFVTHIRFHSSKFSIIPNVIFKQFPQLKVFDGSNVNLHNINSLSLNGAENLQIIFLFNNRLTTINDYCFVHSKNLKVLDLSSNKISRIQALAFSSLTHLEELSLSNNYIKSFDGSPFQPLIGLTWILLDRNEFSVVSSELFTQANQKLLGIHLNNNKIREISPFVFDNLKQLRFLMLSGNNCVNQDFKNFKIPENASVKMELLECHKDYRKTYRPDDDKYNITVQLKKLEDINRQCISETFATLESLNKIQNQIKKMVENSGT